MKAFAGNANIRSPARAACARCGRAPGIGHWLRDPIVPRFHRNFADYLQGRSYNKGGGHRRDSYHYFRNPYEFIKILRTHRSHLLFVFPGNAFLFSVSALRNVRFIVGSAAKASDEVLAALASW